MDNLRKDNIVDHCPEFAEYFKRLNVRVLQVVVMLLAVKWEAEATTLDMINWALVHYLLKSWIYHLLLARPGASNEFIKHQVFEHCEEGDLVINAWTYWDRFILWNADGTIKPSFGSSHEAGVVMMDKYPQFIDHSDWSQDRIDMVMENRYIKQRDNPLVQLASEYELMYYGENYTRFIRFLTDYFAVNSS